MEVGEIMFWITQNLEQTANVIFQNKKVIESQIQYLQKECLMRYKKAKSNMERMKNENVKWLQTKIFIFNEVAAPSERDNSTAHNLDSTDRARISSLSSRGTRSMKRKLEETSSLSSIDSIISMDTQDDSRQSTGSSQLISSESASEPIDVELTPRSLIVGRPPKPFNELSQSGRKHKVKKVLEAADNHPQILFEALIKAVRGDKPKLVKLLKSVQSKREDEIEEINRFIEKQAESPEVPRSTNEAVDLVIDLNLSVNQYRKLSQDSKQRNYDYLPPEYKVLEARKACWPTDIEVLPSRIQVSVESLYVLTMQRLFHSREEVLERLFEKCTDGTLNLNLFMSWGYDGSTGHSRYNSRQKVADGSIISTSCNLLAVKSQYGNLYWNRTPSSIRTNRPLRYEFAKESDEKSLATYNHFKPQFDALSDKPYEFSWNNKKVR